MVGIRTLTWSLTLSRKPGPKHNHEITIVSHTFISKHRDALINPINPGVN